MSTTATTTSEELLENSYTDSAVLSEGAVGYMALNSDGDDNLVDSGDRVVIDESRRLYIPDDVKRIAVQFDHNVNKVTFSCPRYWDGLDLSVFAVEIKYIRPDGEASAVVAQNVIVDPTDENMIQFEWSIKEHVTQVAGTIKIQICAKNGANHWNSEVNSDMYISEGIPCNTGE